MENQTIQAMKIYYVVNVEKHLGIVYIVNYKEVKMNEEFEQLQEENNNLRMSFAGCISGLTPKQQNKILKLLGEIINIEIEQEKLCNI